MVLRGSVGIQTKFWCGASWEVCLPTDSFREGGCVDFCLLCEKLDWVDGLMRLYCNNQKTEEKKA